MKFHIPDIESIPAVAMEFLRAAGDKRIFAFHGDLGAGKTTFIKALCEQLGVEDAMSSPSFSIVNEYHADGKSVFHFDLYRLRKPEEAFDIGLEEYLYSGNYCFVEWPEMAGELLPEETVHVFISEEAGVRCLVVG